MFSTVIEYLPGVLAIFCISFLISGFISMISLLIAIESFDTDEALQNVGLTVFTICFMITTWFGCGITTDIILQKTNVPTYSQKYDALIKQEKINLINQEHRDSITKFIEESFPTISEEGKNSLCDHIITYIANNINLQTDYTIKLMFASEDNVEFYKKNIDNLKRIYTDCNTNDLVLEFLLKEKCKEECQTLHDKVYKINSKFIIES